MTNPAVSRGVKALVRDWIEHKRDFNDTSYWAPRFAKYQAELDRYKPRSPTRLWRSERTDIANQYERRFTSWSLQDSLVENFGWGARRLVTTLVRPEEIAASLPHLGLDREGLGEIIVRPGSFHVIPWHPVWDRRGLFNAFEDPARAAAAGIIPRETGVVRR